MLSSGACCRVICTAGGLAGKMKACIPVVSVICGLKNIQSVGSDALPVSMTCCPPSQGKKKKARPNVLEWVAQRCTLCRCVGVRNVQISCLGQLVTVQRHSALHGGFSTCNSSRHVKLLKSNFKIWNEQPLEPYDVKTLKHMIRVKINCHACVPW